MGLPGLLDRWVPPDDARLALDPAAVLGAVIANLCTEHRPLYGLADWAAGYEPAQLGLLPGQAALCNDDRAGRALDLLFEADRASMMTALSPWPPSREYQVSAGELHNDSTSLALYGAYRQACGGQASADRQRRGQGHQQRPAQAAAAGAGVLQGPPPGPQAAGIDPDRSSADGFVPFTARMADGNTGDDATHIQTWEECRAIAGTPGFLYVADSKLAGEDAMRHIDRRGGRFITVLPRSRKEDAAFRAWMQDHQPDWAEAHRAPGARLGDPDQVWSVCQAPAPSAEGYRIVWVHDTGKQQRDAATRARRIEKARTAIEDDLAARLASPRSRLRTAAAVHAAAADAIAAADATRWIRYAVHETTQVSYRQASRGAARPGHRLPADREEGLRRHLRGGRRPGRPQRRQRRLLAADHQRQEPDRGPGARGLPLPAEPGTPPSPAQGHPGRGPRSGSRPSPGSRPSSSVTSSPCSSAL